MKKETEERFQKFSQGSTEKYGNHNEIFSLNVELDFK